MTYPHEFLSYAGWLKEHGLQNSRENSNLYEEYLGSLPTKPKMVYPKSSFLTFLTYRAWLKESGLEHNEENWFKYRDYLLSLPTKPQIVDDGARALKEDENAWRIGCRTALEILVKIQEGKPLVFENDTGVQESALEYPILFITGQQRRAAPGYRCPYLYVAYDEEQFVSFCKLNEQDVNAGHIFCLAGVNPDDWPRDDTWGIWNRNLELPIDIHRVIKHVTADAWGAYNRQDDEWNIACQDALAILAKAQEGR
jgi:hypothetical protein